VNSYESEYEEFQSHREAFQVSQIAFGVWELPLLRRKQHLEGQTFSKQNDF